MAQEPLKPFTLEGVYAYAEKSIYAGETVSLRVSSSVPYSMAVVRLGTDTDQPSSTDTPLPQCQFQDFPAVPQPITPGSYVNVEQQLPPQDELKELTLECWVSPWRVSGDWQGLITQYTFDGACGFGLFIDDNGCVNFYVGDGGQFQPAWLHTGPTLLPLNWAHVVGVWDSSTGTASLWVNGAPSGSWSMPAGFQLKPGTAPLRLGAYGNGAGSSTPYTQYCLDGDIAMPVIYGIALTPAQIAQRFSEKGLQAPEPDGLLGCWPLTEERGDRLADISGFKRDGQIINHATWMIGGPSFDGAGVARFPLDYDPAQDATRGHGLRLASDDLYDCGWDVTTAYTIPADASPGIYAGRILYGDDFQSVYDVSFAVRKPRGSKSDVLVLCSSNTWFAYNMQPFQETGEQMAPTLQRGAPLPSPAAAAARASASQPPAYCFYQNHQAGQPTYFVGLNMPCPYAQPYELFATNNLNYSHLVRAERFLHLWLESQLYDFDLATDLDLNSDPQLLDNCRVLVINGHSEYWSAPSYENVEAFLNKGGRVAVLSGNTMFWRVSFDPTGTVMECRKVPYYPGECLGGRQFASIGEMWHSDDFQRGGVMREAGYPAYLLIGMECAGWFDDAYTQNFGVYQCSDADAPLFNTPLKTGLKTGDSFGYVQSGVGAVGHEYDIRVSNPQMFAVPPASTPPAGAPIPSAPPGVKLLAQSLRPVDTDQGPCPTVFDYFLRWYSPIPPSPTLLLAEMIYWERPAGGAVFHAGAIGSGWSLSYDPVMQKLMSNVLSNFGVSPRTARTGR